MKFVISFMADSEVTEIIVTVAKIVYGVRQAHVMQARAAIE